MALLPRLQNTSQLLGHLKIKDRLQAKITNIEKHIRHFDDKDTLLSMEKHLDTCIAIINITNDNMNKEPANKHIQQQRRFYSTTY